MAFGQEYADQYAHFIAGGRTLEIIKQYEADCENPQLLLDDIAREYGAESLKGGRYNATFRFAEKTTHPALEFMQEKEEQDGSTVYLYDINTETPEGAALYDKMADIPSGLEMTYALFAKRLTGQQDVATNPDHLRDQSYTSGHYSLEHKTTSAMYRKYGDTYVVSVPRTVRGVFNVASEKDSEENGYPCAAGYRYEWFTPQDSTPIPYSKVVELREKTLGDQLAPRRVPQKLPAFPNRKN
ncbi:MAG: hypothetical protein EP349_07450 [Alphaproteobacteria bacterium]|nr:MAG: hypothetical protein EP349_07450 [Alphaproteobacteria bacterium]